MKYLFLDDERMPADVTWVLIGDDLKGTANWSIVRSFDEAVKWVEQNGFPDVISFDHDLGYEEYDTTTTGLVIVTNATEDKSGYDFAKWLVEHDLETGSMPVNFKFTVHSKNPTGAKNIQMLLDNYIEFRKTR